MKEKRTIKGLLKSPLMVIVLAIALSVILSHIETSHAITNYLYDSKDVSYDNTKSGIIATDVQGAVDELYGAATDYSSMNTRMTTMENNFLDKTYPVGSIYIGVNNINPSTLLGGTWEAFGQGRTLIGVGTGTDSNSTQKVFASNETGGEYSHTLTINEMPSHDHNSSRFYMVYDPGLGWHSTSYGVASNSGSYLLEAAPTWRSSSTGGSQSHNIIQPYITVYMWKRTA